MGGRPFTCTVSFRYCFHSAVIGTCLTKGLAELLVKQKGCRRKQYCVLGVLYQGVRCGWWRLTPGKGRPQELSQSIVSHGLIFISTTTIRLHFYPYIDLVTW